MINFLLTILRYFLKSISRPKVIIISICLTITAILIGFIIPQIGTTPTAYFQSWHNKSPNIYLLIDTLQLNRVYSSLWFLSLVILISVSLSKSLWMQIKQISQTLNIISLKRKIPTHCINSLNTESLPPFMRCKGYTLQEAHDRIYLFSKHEFAKWGSVIFHFGLMLIILAGIWRLAFLQRGFIPLIEGDRINGQSEEFLSSELGLLQKRFDPGLKIFLDEFHHTYWDTNKIKEISSSIVFLDENNNKLSKATVAINHPIRHDGISIHQTFDYGYTISFRLKGPDGTESQSHFILEMQHSKNDPAKGVSDFPFTPYIFDMEFYPDLSRNSFLLNKPILNLSISHLDGGNIFTGLVLPGDTIRVENNLLQFNRISYWSGLVFERSADMSVAYTGFILVCIGTGLMFFFTPRKILFLMEDKKVYIYGWSKRFRALFNLELADIIMDIEK